MTKPNAPAAAPARRASAWAGAIAAALALSACATPKPAALQLPPALAGLEPVAIDGITPGRQGQARLAGLNARFERRADRVDLFDRLQVDRAALRFRVDDEAEQAECRQRGETLTRGVMNLPLRPSRTSCTLPQAGGAGAARLELAPRAAALNPEQRQGSLQLDGRQLEIESLHRVAGSPLPLAAPVGWLFTLQGRPVAALELTGRRPRLWRDGAALADPALAGALARAALALALLWDPAHGGDA